VTVNGFRDWAYAPYVAAQAWGGVILRLRCFVTIVAIVATSFDRVRGRGATPNTSVSEAFGTEWALARPATRRAARGLVVITVVGLVLKEQIGGPRLLWFLLSFIAAGTLYWRAATKTDEIKMLDWEIAHAKGALN
jgi:hypothetical protein